MEAVLVIAMGLSCASFVAEAEKNNDDILATDKRQPTLDPAT